MSDPAISAYYALRPIEYQDVERLLVVQAEAEESYGVRLELVLRHVTDPHRKLCHTFTGVANLRITPPERAVLQLSVLTIRSIAERQWESVSYLVKDEDDILSFLCEDFTAVVEGSVPGCGSQEARV